MKKFFGFILGLLIFSATEVYAQQFWRGASVDDIAGLYSHIQIWNPVGSGKICTVKLIIISGPDQGMSAGITFTRLSDAPYAQPGGIDVKNAAPNSATGVCEIRTQNSATLIDLGQMVNLNLRLDSPLVLNAMSIQISPGSGFMVRSGIAQRSLQLSYAYDESLP